jgi:hypothetical protein
VSSKRLYRKERAARAAGQRRATLTALLRKANLPMIALLVPAFVVWVVFDVALAPGR